MVTAGDEAEARRLIAQCRCQGYYQAASMMEKLLEECLQLQDQVQQAALTS